MWPTTILYITKGPKSLSVWWHAPQKFLKLDSWKCIFLHSGAGCFIGSSIFFCPLMLIPGWLGAGSFLFVYGETMNKDELSTWNRSRNKHTTPYYKSRSVESKLKASLFPYMATPSIFWSWVRLYMSTMHVPTKKIQARSGCERQ